MPGCKALEILRNEAYFVYAAMTKDLPAGRRNEADACLR